MHRNTHKQRAEGTSTDTENIGGAISGAEKNLVFEVFVL